MPTHNEKKEISNRKKNLTKIFFNIEIFEALAYEYISKYKTLKKAELIAIFTYNTRHILGCFSIYHIDSNQQCMEEIELLKFINNNKIDDSSIGKLHYSLRSVYFSRYSSAGHISYIFKDEAIENSTPEQYTQVCDEITNKLIVEITNYVFNSLPENIKIEETVPSLDVNNNNRHVSFKN